MRYDEGMQTIWQFIVKVFFLLVGLGIVLGVGMLMAREYILWQGIKSMRADLRSLARLTSATSCAKEFGAVGSGEQPYRQLRFTSDRDYTLELVCPRFPDQPLAQEQRTLARFISKMPGSAGIIDRLEVAESYVGLVVFHELATGLPEVLQPWLQWVSRGELIGLEAGAVMTKPLTDDATLTVATRFGTGPVSTCEGYGFSCCDTQREFGMGDRINDLPSCPGNCYARCLPRPLIVSWKSNPLPDWETKAVVLPSGGSVQFFYVLEDATAAGPWTAQVQFGDGLFARAEGKSGVVEHRYTCAIGSCEYIASVVVENAHGARSAQTELVKLKVVVGTMSVLPSEDMY